MSVTASRQVIVIPSRREAMRVCVYALLTGVACAGLSAAAILLSAPAAVVPLVAVASAVLPMLACWRLAESVRALRFSVRRTESAVVAELRRALAELPETEHPLGY